MKTRKKKWVPLNFALIPQNLVAAPLFPPLPQKTEYTIDCGAFKWTIGCQNPLKFRQYDTPYRRGFDIRHFDLIAALIEKYRSGDFDEKHQLYINQRGLLCMIHKMPGGKTIEYISKLLDDLLNTNMEVEVQEESSVLFRVLSSVIVDKTTGILTSVRLSDEFVSFIKAFERVVNFRLDTKAKMPSLIAQSIYTFLPSRAIHHTAARPFEITLSKLLQDLHLDVPPTPSERKRIFTQNTHPILDQLNYAPLAGGKKLRVEIKPTQDQKDYKLCAWVDRLDEKYYLDDPDGSLYDAWSAAGRTDEEFRLRSGRITLLPQEIDYLQIMQINVEAYKHLLERAKALASPGIFAEILSDCVYRVQTDTVFNPPQYFWVALKNSFVPVGAQMTLGLEEQNERI